MFNSCHLLRTTCLSALILCLVLLPYGVAQEEPALAVTVIAVTSFKHGPDSGSNLKISQEIDAAAEHLRAFFEKHYKVPVRVLKSPEQTTSSAIRTFLFDDLPYDSRRVHLLFVLSHGMAKSYPNSPANSELFIASSDTDDQQPEAGAIRGEELLSGIGHLANGTSAFLFVDTCNSAAIGSFAARLSDLATSQATLSRTMVLASSLEDQYSFNARFTEALLRVWSSPEGRCSATARDISSTLAAAMHQVDPASHATAQDVSLALRYETVRDFCVESFMTSHALLILSNASYNSAWVSFTPDDSDIGVINVPPRSVVPVLLSRSSYKIVISKNSDPGVVPDRFSEVNLDFTGDFVKVQPVTEVPSVEARDPEVLAATNQKAADLLEAWESTSRSAVLALRLTAKAAYEESLRQNEKQIADLSASLPASRQDIIAVQIRGLTIGRFRGCRRG